MSNATANVTYDVAIVGGGIIGLATARTWAERCPQRRLLLLEKEPHLAMHQTGHNSGVIHSGAYYRPGSLKARLCVRGVERLTAFCEAHRIPYQRCGKVIVAVEPEEQPRLQALYERGVANGVPGIARIGPERLREIEPHVNGLRAIHLPQVAIVDFVAVAQAMAHEVTRVGGTVMTAARVVRIARRAREWFVQTTAGDYCARYLINCGGLHADRLAQRAGERRPVRIVPFRGEYFTLTPSVASLIRGLVYPVPDPAMPFLGVHLTKMLDGGVHAGPSAILAWRREGYTRGAWSARDIADLISYAGFWRMARRHWRAGWHELRRACSRRLFLRDVQRLLPLVEAHDLQPSPAGVRAQAVDPRGILLDDFMLTESRDALHVLNAPSPAATASLAIGEMIAERALAVAV